MYAPIGSIYQCQGNLYRWSSTERVSVGACVKHCNCSELCFGHSLCNHTGPILTKMPGLCDLGFQTLVWTYLNWLTNAKKEHTWENAWHCKTKKRRKCRAREKKTTTSPLSFSEVPVCLSQVSNKHVSEKKQTTPTSICLLRLRIVWQVFSWGWSDVYEFAMVHITICESWYTVMLPMNRTV